MALHANVAQIPAAATTQDPPVHGQKRKERDEEEITHQFDMYVCLTSRTRSPTTGHLTPYFVVLPEMPRVSTRVGDMAQSTLGCFLVPQSGDKQVNLPSISTVDPTVNAVFTRLRATHLYSAILVALDQLGTGVVWQNNKFHFHPTQVTYAQMVPVQNVCEFNYLTNSSHLTVLIVQNAAAKRAESCNFPQCLV